MWSLPCLAVILAVFSPRVALVAVWLFSDILSRSLDSRLLPLIGFFLLPWTTLAYAVLWSTGSHGVHGLEIFLVIFAFLVDLGSYFGGERARAAR